jgi:hypothetical protein
MIISTLRESHTLSDGCWNTFQNFEIDIGVRLWKLVEETVQPTQKPATEGARRRTRSFTSVCCDNGSPQDRTDG